MRSVSQSVNIPKSWRVATLCVIWSQKVTAGHSWSQLVTSGHRWTRTTNYLRGSQSVSAVVVVGDVRGQLGELGDEVDGGLVHEAQDVPVDLRPRRVRAADLSVSVKYHGKMVFVRDFTPEIEVFCTL